MTGQLYVATDAHGVQRIDDTEVAWGLPSPDGSPGETTASKVLVLRSAAALLDELDERIFVAQPAGTSSESDETGASVGNVVVTEARLVAETPWNAERAAQLALDCAEHVLGDAAGAVLPGGATLGEVLAEARRVLVSASDDAEMRLGVLARLSAARRLRRRGELVGNAAFGALQDDLGVELDALDDPAWATLATVRDAVLGAVEAVRHLALPRYVAARERSYEDEESGDDTRSSPGRMIVTPWGPITLGAEHQPDYVPAWIAARDAAQRARDAVQAREGGDAGTHEHAWQADRLAQILGAHPA